MYAISDNKILDKLKLDNNNNLSLVVDYASEHNFERTASNIFGYIKFKSSSTQFLANEFRITNKHPYTEYDIFLRIVFECRQYFNYLKLRSSLQYRKIIVSFKNNDSTKKLEPKLGIKRDILAKVAGIAKKYNLEFSDEYANSRINSFNPKK